jgi:GNAT superfamily N-acetyltransferase
VPRQANITVRQKIGGDQPWICDVLRRSWGSTTIVSRGVLHDASQLAALVALYQRKKSGLLTYRISQDQCEIVTLNSLFENIGIGTTLLEAVERQASLQGCTRTWLVTTNDNTRALGFYKKRGFHVVEIHLGVIEKYRKLKPEIPILGFDRIPILDEIELEHIPEDIGRPA